MVQNFLISRLINESASVQIDQFFVDLWLFILNFRILILINKSASIQIGQFVCRFVAVFFKFPDCVILVLNYIRFLSGLSYVQFFQFRLVFLFYQKEKLSTMSSLSKNSRVLVIRKLPAEKQYTPISRQQVSD